MPSFKRLWGKYGVMISSRKCVVCPSVVYHLVCLAAEQAVCLDISFSSFAIN